MKITYERFLTKYEKQINNIVEHLGPASTGDYMKRRLEIISLIGGEYFPNGNPDLGKIYLSKQNLTLFLLKWSKYD